MRSIRPIWAVLPLFPILPFFFLGVGSMPSGTEPDRGRVLLATEHDVVVEPSAPRTVKIAATKSEVAKKVRVKVRNADPAGSAPFVVRLIATDGDCPAGTVTGLPDFGPKAGADPATIELAAGRAATAVVPVVFRRSAFDTHNDKTPERCALAVEARPDSPGDVDPTPGNAAVRPEIDVIDLGDTPATALHETVLAGMRPLKIKINRTKTGAAKTVSVKVTNADLLPAPELPGHEVTLAAEDGDCPAGTVGSPDFDTRQGGAQPTKLVAGGKRATAKLTLTIDGASFFTPNQASPARCTALVRVTGPAGNVEPETSNDVARLVIDVTDQADEGLPTPTPEPSPTSEPTATPTPSPTPTPDVTATPSPTPTSGVVLPPEPADVAPPIDPTVATDTYEATRFLYEAPTPIQTGVAPGAIDPQRAAVLRGRVLDRSGAPLPGVTVTVLGHPEYGQTLSRASGGWDLAANGGGPLTVDFRKDGFLPAQRTLDVPWRDYAIAPDVVLIALDAAVTRIDLSSPAPMQVARGGVATDADGTRRATLLFAQGTQAELVFADGSTAPVGELDVRATEYTIGDDGPLAMPAELPPSSGYTYAVELSADQVSAAGARSVRFDRPVLFYLENFLGFPVGTQVPTAFYDDLAGAWVPIDDGRVVAIVGIDAGLAQVDTDGDGLADAGLGIDDAERAQLASLYAVGQSLWRVGVDHFTPHDMNFPIGGPLDAITPSTSSTVTNDPLENDPDGQPRWGTIQLENQTLVESVPLVGSPLRLSYASDRVPARSARIAVPITGPSVPASLKYVTLNVWIAGRRVAAQSFPALPDQTYEVVWDGLDGYGRRPQGQQSVGINLSYVYEAFYYVPQGRARSFGYPGDAGVLIPARRNWVTTQQLRERIATAGGLDARGIGLGGWSISAHHLYDPQGRTLYLGDGSRRSASNTSFQVFERFAGGGSPPDYVGDGLPAVEARLSSPFDVATGPDGSVYVTDLGQHRVRRIAPDGTISTVAGTGDAGFTGDGGPATAARLDMPSGVTVGSDGSVFIADTNNGRVRRVAPDGTITTVAGNGTIGSGGDGGPATAAQLAAPTGIAVAPDGTVFVADTSAHRVRRIGPDGTIGTFAGTGSPGYDADGVPAHATRIFSPTGLALAPDGSLYVADTENERVRRIGPDGVIHTVAGNGSSGDATDGTPAVSSPLDRPLDVALGADGSVYFSEQLGGRVRRVRPDGVLVTAAGEIPTGGYGSLVAPRFAGLAAKLVALLGADEAEASGVALPSDGETSTSVTLSSAVGLAILPDGDLLLGDADYGAVFRVTPVLAGFSADDILIPSDDGAVLYRFDDKGRHLETRHAFTGATLFSFTYDAAGRLASVLDASGNALVVERDGSGMPTGIVTPYGQRTTLETDANGWLARVVDPLGHDVTLATAASGALLGVTTPRNATYAFTYDGSGRLLTASDEGGALQTFAQSQDPSFAEVTMTTDLGRATSRRVEARDDDAELRTATFADGTSETEVLTSDGTRITTSPDGTVTTLTLGPDPRFGLEAPLPRRLEIETPSGLGATIEASRTAELVAPGQPLQLTSWYDDVVLNGRTTRRSYDPDTRTFSTVTPSGRTGTLTMDAVGRIAATELPPFVPRTVAYDARGRVTSVTQASGGDVRTTSLTWDALGRPATMTDALGNSASFEWNAAGRLLAQVFPDGRRVEMAYDANGNVVSLTPPGGAAHGFAYTPIDLMSQHQSPGVGVTTYAWGSDRQLLAALRADGDDVAFAYDAAGRLATVTSASGTTSHAYDPASGRLASVSNPSGTVAFAFDGFLPVAATWSGVVSGSVERAFDADFRVVARTVNGGGSVTFDYDDDGLLVHAGDLVIGRDWQNGLIDGAWLGGIAESWTYDPFGDPASYAATFGGGTLYGLSWVRDRLGRVVEETETVGGTSTTRGFSYDTSGRLVAVHENGALATSYAWDGNGNRLSRTPAGLPAETGTYDVEDRLVSYDGATYAFDASGDLVNRTQGAQTATYAYDALGNLLEVGLPGGPVVTYAVDGRNRRIRVAHDGVPVRGVLWDDGLRPAAELDGAGAVVSTFVYGTRRNVPDYVVKGGVTYRILADRLGSPRLVVNVATGAVAQRLDYDEFGRVLTDTNPGFQPFGWAGGLYDPDTGLVRFGARDYDARTGRFTTKDPGFLTGGDVNPYGYVLGDPVNHTDVTGFRPDYGRIAGGVLQIVGGGIAIGVAGVSTAATAGIASPIAITVGVTGGYSFGAGVRNVYEGIVHPTEQSNVPGGVGEATLALAIAGTGGSNEKLSTGQAIGSIVDFATGFISGPSVANKSLSTASDVVGAIGQTQGGTVLLSQLAEAGASNPSMAAPMGYNTAQSISGTGNYMHQ